MMTKEEVLKLLGTNEMDKLFKVLQSHFKGENDVLNGLMKDFVSPPPSMSEATFFSRMRVFINMNYNLKKLLPEPDQIDYYKALCELDFKLQSHHFRRIYKHKKIAAFLLHGDTDEYGNDQRWLYNQLLDREGLSIERPIIIDLNSKLGGTAGRLFEEFFIAFDVINQSLTWEDQLLDLRSALEERLVSGHLVCIIKSPESLLANEIELCLLFKDFFSFMNRIRQKGHKHSLIFLFIEQRLANYNSKMPNYFMWFDKDNKENYSSTAVSCTDLKIFDLAPIAKVEESDIRSWIDWSLEYPELYQKVSLIRGRETEILDNGGNPFQVIAKICKELNIEIEKKWTE